MESLIVYLFGIKSVGSKRQKKGNPNSCPVTRFMNTFSLEATTSFSPLSMAAQSFYSNWPTSHQCHYETTIPPRPELLHFHDNHTLSDNTCINNPLLFNSNYKQFAATNFPIPKPIKYPVLSSSYNPPITTLQQPSSPTLPLPGLTQSPHFTHEYDSNPVVPNECYYGHGEFLMNPVDLEWTQPEYYSYLSYPVVPNVCSMEEVQPELPPLPETYDGSGSSSVMVPSCGFGCNAIQGKERSVQMKEIGDGRERISAQSMAARVRRRKISEKTSELGKLVPGGHRMTTAGMFQAAFKYIKFLQAQVGVLQLMQLSPEVGAELHALVTSPLVQEKLFAAGKCIATQALGENLSQ